ncbi:MAG TPA: hypothetical protein VJP80_01975 [Candidatus Saccharimonadales bacterium]|nr:hypothetical protein [Candidatus Saccharimonadales bacterium]
MRIAFVVRCSLRLLTVASVIAGTAGWVSPLTAEAAAGSVTQVATAVVNSGTSLAMSGTASCTGGGTDSIQTVLVSQGLTVGAVGTTSNTFVCDGAMYPWGIQEGTTLGSWVAGSNVTSVVAFSSSLITTNMATLTPPSGTTFTVWGSGDVVNGTTAYAQGTTSCTGGGTKTVQLQYNEYQAGVSAGGSASVSCDGSAHNWRILMNASGGSWSGELGTAVANLQDGNNQTIATYTGQVSLAA